MDDGGRKLYFPIRLRCAALTDALTNPELEDALARALGRAFARARAALPDAGAIGAGVALQPPYLAPQPYQSAPRSTTVERGAGGTRFASPDLTPDDAATLLARVSCAIEQAARAQGVPIAVPMRLAREQPLSAPGQRAPEPVPAELAGHGGEQRGPEPAPSMVAAPPAEVSEPFDPQRFDPLTNTYEVPSYQGGRRPVPVRTTADPFARVLDLLDKYLAALADLIGDQGNVKDPNDARRQLKDRLDTERSNIQIDRDSIRLARDVYQGRVKESDLHAYPLAELEYQSIVQLYSARGRAFPARERIARHEELVRRALALVAIIRARVADLDRQANTITATVQFARQTTFNPQIRATVGADQEILRQTIMDVGSFYLELPVIDAEIRYSTATTFGNFLDRSATAMQEAFARLAFLDTFYSDPLRVQLYAAARFARQLQVEIEKNLVAVAAAPTSYYSGPIITSGTFAPGTATTALYFSQTPGARKWVQSGIAHLSALTAAIDLAQFVRRQLDAISDLPKKPQDVRGTPSSQLAVLLSAAIMQLQGDIAVLAVWADVANILNVLHTNAKLGTVVGGRDGWFRDLANLEQELSKEFNHSPHSKNLQGLVEGWERRLETLTDNIRSVAKREGIIAAVVGALPFLLFGGIAASSVGAWVGTMTNGSRLLIALAEGATFTLFSALTTPASFQPTTATGWAIEFGVNVALAGFGRFFRLFEVGVDVAEGLSLSRRLLLAGGALTVTSLVQTTLQSAAQSLEDRARRQGGESSFTEMLTVNLILNALVMLVHAGLSERTRAGTELNADQLVADIQQSRGITISKDAADRWLALRARANQFMADFQAALKRGTLTEEEFNAWKQRGKDLARDLEQQLPDLVKVLGTGQTPDQIRGLVGRFRGLLDSLSYTPGRVQALPEYLAGLKRVGSTETWVYDPTRPGIERDLATALRRTYGGTLPVRELPDGSWVATDPQGRTIFAVRKLPDGGWEVSDPQGIVLFRALPAAPEVARLLPPSLEDIAGVPKVKGPLTAAQKGLSEVQMQTTVPELPAQLAQAASQYGTAPVNSLLKVMGDAIAPENEAAWRGLSTYLKVGGNAEVLARTLVAGDADHVSRVLEVNWDAQATHGLAILDQLSPRPTGSQLARIFADFTPVQARAIFRNIDTVSARANVVQGRVLARVLLDLHTTPGITPAERTAVGQIGADGWARVLDYARSNRNPFSVKGKLAEELFVQTSEFMDIWNRALDRAARENIPTTAVELVRDVRGIAPTRTTAGAPAELGDAMFVAIQGDRVRILAVFESKSPTNRVELAQRPGEFLGQIEWDLERLRENPVIIKGHTFQPDQVTVSRTGTEWIGVAPPDFNLSPQRIESIRSGMPGFELIHGPVRDNVLNIIAVRILALLPR